MEPESMSFRYEVDLVDIIHSALEREFLPGQLVYGPTDVPSTPYFYCKPSLAKRATQSIVDNLKRNLAGHQAIVIGPVQIERVDNDVLTNVGYIVK
jgi:hypothetical protein